MWSGNIHATAVLLGANGILIMGPSGSGKTMLALSLIGRWRAAGRFAALVSDDRVDTGAFGGRLVGRAPDTIAGLVEIPPLGPVGIAVEPHAVIDRVVRLVDAGALPRLADPASQSVGGIDLPRLDVAARHSQAGANAVSAWLDRPVRAR